MQKKNGTYFIADCEASRRQIRLIPFEFSFDGEKHTFVLEVGLPYLRVFDLDGEVNASQANPK